jgi:hypothetical protein
MAKKVSPPVLNGKQLTADAILDLIDRLPPDEQAELFELLFDHPNNEPVRRLAKRYKTLQIAWESSRECERVRHEMNSRMYEDHQRITTDYHQSMLQMVKDAHRHEAEAIQELGTKQNKRPMDPESIETLHAYYDLLGQGLKQKPALLRLVNLPGEYDKDYAKAYREKGNDLAGLRNNIRSKLRNHKKLNKGD